jgi:hypothetical protein
MRGRMLKRTLLVAAAIAGVAAVAVARDMTPQQAMEKMMNCMACKPMNDYPQIGANIRYDIKDTKTGFVASFLMADESLMPAYKECEKKCEAARAEAMKLTDEEAAARLCPFCAGLRKLMARDDVTIDNIGVTLGQIMVATSSTKEGVAALHDYSMMARETSALLDKAVVERQQQGDHAEKK